MKSRKYIYLISHPIDHEPVTSDLFPQKGKYFVLFEVKTGSDTSTTKIGKTVKTLPLVKQSLRFIERPKPLGGDLLTKSTYLESRESIGCQNPLREAGWWVGGTIVVIVPMLVSC